MVRKFFNTNAYAYLLALIGIVFFSSKAVLVKVAYGFNIDAVSILTLRMLFALPIYIVLAIISTLKQRSSSLNKKDYLFVIALGFLGYYLASILDFKGLQYISASLERLILFIYPTMVLLISALFFKVKPSREQKIAVVITYIGVLLAFYNYVSSDGDSLLLGAIFIVLSAITYAFYLVGTGSLIPKFGIWRFTSYAMIVATIGIVIHYFINRGGSLWDYPAEIYQLSAIMAVVCTIIPSLLLAEAIRILGSSNVAVLGSVGPISTIVLAVIFLDEKITIYQILGTVIVIAGISFLGKNKATSSKKVNC
ncbi:DMT family transporter [Saccharicrinis aurantiacus]|uniref:DMT family transporter n=1 Tax=Saccharicrinis aurantiacus TaxID=1849719 RepID=UPI0008384380|nr:DMT family transporter [Saccharicrinis aurantiacus]